MYENLSDPMPLKKEIKLYTGTGNPELAEKIADILHRLIIAPLIGDARRSGLA